MTREIDNIIIYYNVTEYILICYLCARINFTSVLQNSTLSNVVA